MFNWRIGLTVRLKDADNKKPAKCGLLFNEVGISF